LAVQRLFPASRSRCRRPTLCLLLLLCHCHYLLVYKSDDLVGPVAVPVPTEVGIAPFLCNQSFALSMRIGSQFVFGVQLLLFCIQIILLLVRIGF
jgi:hypothetical protein